MASDTNPIDRKAFSVIPAYAQCIILNKAPMTTSIIAKKNRIKRCLFFIIVFEIKKPRINPWLKVTLLFLNSQIF